jgi:hypothetical protein
LRRHHRSPAQAIKPAGQILKEPLVLQGVEPLTLRSQAKSSPFWTISLPLIGRSHNFQKFWESKLRRFAGQLAHEFQSGTLIPPLLVGSTSPGNEQKTSNWSLARAILPMSSLAIEQLVEAVSISSIWRSSSRFFARM